MKLSYTEELFLTEYLKCGGNGTKAYLAVRPNASPRSAAVCANRLLKKPAVIEALQVEVDKNIASRSQLIQEAHDVKERAKKDGKLQVELNSIDLKGKLAGIYKEPTEDEMEKYNIFIQRYMIKPEDEKEEKKKTIDITPKSED